MGAEMTSEETPDHAPAASGSYGDLFLPAPDADTSEQRRVEPDESEAAMGRLRTPFDVGATDVEHRR
jgi:hypothetical protein